MNYSVLEYHIPLLRRLAEVGNSGITVFDMCRKKHVFTSCNFFSLFGYDLNKIEELGNEYFDSRIHPDDYAELMNNGVILLEYCYSLPQSERSNYKFINEYRILNAEGKYIRVIEQHQTLELDKKGNIWLVIGIIDLSPDQRDPIEVKGQLVNFKTGNIVYTINNNAKMEPDVPLSKRETEILNLVKDGLLSKEISDKLSISVHTVNTHRQRILEKLGVDNSHEAVKLASGLGLLS